MTAARRRRSERKGETVKKTLTALFAAAVLVALCVPVAGAKVNRSLPTKHLHAIATKKKVSKLHATGGLPTGSLVCPEQAPGDTWGYCVLVPLPGTSVTNVTYNDGAGT
jgi:hypothetical protein